MKVYRCRHKETGEFWGARTYNYDKPSAIKSAWSTSYGSWGRLPWNEQTEYEIVEYELVEKELYVLIEKILDHVQENCYDNPHLDSLIDKYVDLYIKENR